MKKGKNYLSNESKKAIKLKNKNKYILYLIYNIFIINNIKIKDKIKIKIVIVNIMLLQIIII